MNMITMELSSPQEVRSRLFRRCYAARRREIAFSDMEPPRVEPFDFLIIPESTEPADPLAIGHYDPASQQMEMTTWDEVKDLQTKK